MDRPAVLKMDFLHLKETWITCTWRKAMKKVNERLSFVSKRYHQQEQIWSIMCEKQLFLKLALVHTYVLLPSNKFKLEKGLFDSLSCWDHIHVGAVVDKLEGSVIQVLCMLANHWLWLPFLLLVLLIILLPPLVFSFLFFLLFCFVFFFSILISFPLHQKEKKNYHVGKIFCLFFWSSYETEVKKFIMLFAETQSLFKQVKNQSIKWIWNI